MGRNNSTTDIVQRVEEDIARGDLGMAKRRLGASLGSRGYDAVMLGKLGRVCFEMRDPYEAGRHWLLSTVTGPEVDEAIEVFLDRNGRKPAQVASQVMWKMRLGVFAFYPELVQKRLITLGISEHIVRSHRARPSPAPEDLGVFGKLLLGATGLFGLASLVVGGIAIFRFLFSVIREAWMD